jgi:hypothetical protein
MTNVKSCGRLIKRVKPTRKRGGATSSQRRISISAIVCG